MAFRVDYKESFDCYGGYTTISGSGVLKSGFKTYGEAQDYVDWAKENLRHQSYEVVATH